MQLTPRNLVMACAAMLAGGTVFGVITTLMPAVSLPTAAAVDPTAIPTASTAPAGELGDEEITFPASPAPTTISWPTPVSLSPSPAAASAPAFPTPVAPPATPSTPASPTTSQSVAPSTSAAPRPRTTARPGSGHTARPSRAPRPTATPTATRRPAPAPRRTTVTGGWRVPHLHVGDNTIAVPRLTSRATVRVTVGCSPSSGCHASGDQLVIDPAATAVTVTWWAPATAGYRSWQVSRVL